MSPVINRLGAVLLAAGSSIAIAAAGPPPQGQTVTAGYGPSATAAAQPATTLAPVAFWLGLEQDGTLAPRASGSLDAVPPASVPARPRSPAPPQASHVPPLATPAAQHIPPLPPAAPARHVPALPVSPAAAHVPSLPQAEAAQHVPPLPASADAAKIRPLQPRRVQTERAATDGSQTEVLKPLAITYVVPGPMKPEATAPATASEPPAANATRSHEHKATAVAPLPLPPAPAPQPPMASTARKPVVRVADAPSTTTAPVITKLKPKASSAGALEAKSAASSTEVKNPPVGHLKIGVGGGILVHLPEPAATVFAANPNVARVEAASPTAIFVIGMQAGSTNLIATDPSGAAIAQWVVTVGGKVEAPQTKKKKVAGKHHYRGPVRPYVPTYTTLQTRRMQEAINNVVPGANLVKIKKVGDAYILTGVVATPEIAQEVETLAKALGASNMMDKMEVLSSIQVNVRVRVADVSRTMVHQLGLNWSALGAKGKWQIGTFTPNSGPTSGTISTTTSNGVTTNELGITGGLSPLVTASGAGALYQAGVGYTSGLWNLNAVLNALATNSLATILAEPNLTVESGHTAKFLSGGQYPIPAPSTASNSIAIEYKNYGVSLNVTPTVIAPDKISLTVKPTVSNLDYGHAIQIAGTAVPALTVQSASTTVQLGSGQAFAIAGLLQSRTSQTENGLPGAEGIPVLGALFRNDNFQRDSQELVIIVTPYLVNPVSNPAKLHAPTDHFVPATTLQQILYGKQMQGNDKAPKSTPPLDAGFLME